MKRAKNHGVSLDETAPSKWIKVNEPTKTQADRKRKEKRRRITEKCLDALDEIKKMTDRSPPKTIEELFDLLHDNGNQSH